MYKKITAFAIIIILCFSMITPVFAASSITSTSTIEWTKSTIDGEVYQISYWHPTGMDKYYIIGQGNQIYVIYYNSENSSLSEVRYGTGTFYAFGIGPKGGWPGRTEEEQLAVCRDVLYNDESTWRTTTNTEERNEFMRIVTGENQAIIGGAYAIKTWGEQHIDLNLNPNLQNGEDAYVEWYIEKNGAEPPLKGSSDTTMEYNCGRYYAIIRQKGQLNQNGKYVVDSIGNLEFDEQYIYSVICPSPTPNLDGETASLNFFELTPGTKIWQTITGKFKPEHNGKLQKDGYESTGTIDNLKWYYAEINDMNQNGAWDRYYFTSLTEAVRFTKSSSWAQPLFGEMGLQHYVYNVDKIHYNNFYINEDYPINEPNFEEYGMTRTKVFLKQHGVENPKYIYVEYDYAPYKSQLTKNWIFGIYYRDNPIYYVGNSTATDFIPTDTSFYTETEEYYETKTQRFQIWYEGIEDESNTWDIIKSDWSLNVGTESTSRVETLEDEAGNKITINHQTGILYDEDGNEYYYNEETGEYINKDGEIFDLDNFKPVDKDFTDAEVIEDITGLFDRVIQIINDTKHHTEGIVKFLGAIFTRLPSIFTTIIILALIALLIKRAVGRGD